MNAPADPPVLMIGNPAVMSVAPLVYKDLKYDPQKDFVPVAGATDYEFGIAVGSALPLREVSQRSIEHEVLRGLEKNSVRHTDLIQRHTPRLLRGVAKDIAGVQGARLYQQVERGDIFYRIYDLVKD